MHAKLQGLQSPWRANTAGGGPEERALKSEGDKETSRGQLKIWEDEGQVGL